jgi:hypothetical protein
VATKRDRRPTQSGTAGEPPFPRSGFVVLLSWPYGPTTHTFRNRRFINFDIPPFKNGGPDQRRQSRYVKDVAKWKIVCMSISQYVGRRELGNDWDAIRDECEINQVSLIQKKALESQLTCRALCEMREGRRTYKGHDIVRCTTIGNKMVNKGQRVQGKIMRLTPSSRRPGGDVLLIG